MNKLKKMALMVVGQNLNTDELQGGGGLWVLAGLVLWTWCRRH
jgi:hypothetical protein